ncbi:MAG: bifunctional diaminohydroxyphosphoribosylaminopyrimidine deaminase/5-amino-6-(5-phosphoribosylamino)uracil reductase RibD [Verrucomicrobiota bacterium]|nr:bifunctional diaminohydroxyphosphoribosylaminopyrimidine deaminase/5-amino-6-(5-phosphoribosylamino)uracil reductase RibD [Verrucomicrobiota bacterium]MDP7049502.1 bifunctional diaminohydroxyphosphoribosylaminopyrimidine deaminase/5-amino-6-(5-phosphoribosylamino)uracil reductase RibD [Verrucomicrobiota bacterium]
MSSDVQRMREAFRLARRARWETSPNPLVGAVLARRRMIIGRGWHRRAGLPHAEVEAIADAQRRGSQTKGATLYVTLEPCSTPGRTPPCTQAIAGAGIARVVVSATDPNPAHAGRAYRWFKRKGIDVEHGLLADEAAEINFAFNHWITTGLPFVTVKAAMTLDGKIATAAGESKWITSPEARREGMKLRHEADAILVGINTILADDPALTLRDIRRPKAGWRGPALRRIVLDPKARTPLGSRVLGEQTTVVVSRDAPAARLVKLKQQCRVITCPLARRGFRLKPLLRKLGQQGCTHLLVEGGGETNAAFIEAGLAKRVAFFYAPKILGGRNARTAVAGDGLPLARGLRLEKIRWRNLDPDLMLTARVAGAP